MIELRQQLEKERSVRMMLEDQVKSDFAVRPNTVGNSVLELQTDALISFLAWQIRAMDAQLYPEKLKAIALQVQDQQAQTQGLVHLQQQKQLERDLTPSHSPQVKKNICLTHLFPRRSVSIFVI